jgi:hypothetical protein
MNYELKHFSDSYIERQFEIGNLNISKWLGGQQTPADRLRAIYSQEGFDPETKFYALHNNEVIGFIPAVQTGETDANLELPLLMPDHLAAEEPLMEFAFNTLKNKGVRNVVTRASPRWGTTMDLVNKYGYSLKELMWKNARLAVSDYVQQEGAVDVIEVEKDDYDQIKDILVKFRKSSEKEAQNQIALLDRISVRVTSWMIVKENGKIVGHDHLVQDIRDNKKSRMNAIYASNDEIRNGIMNAHVGAARGNGIQYIDNFFFGPTENMDKPYLQYGFEISDLYAYEKRL